MAEVRNRKSITLVSDILLDKLKRFAEEITKFISETGEDSLNAKLSAKVVNLIATNWKNEPNTLIWLKTCIDFDYRSYVPESALTAIAKGWHDEPETLPWLQQRAQSDDNQYVRSTAVQELARGWHDDPEIFELLRNCAVNDPFPLGCERDEYNHRE